MGINRESAYSKKVQHNYNDMLFEYYDVTIDNHSELIIRIYTSKPMHYFILTHSLTIDYLIYDDIEDICNNHDKILRYMSKDINIEAFSIIRASIDFRENDIDKILHLILEGSKLCSL